MFSLAITPFCIYNLIPPSGRCLEQLYVIRAMRNPKQPKMKDDTTQILKWSKFSFSEKKKIWQGCYYYRITRYAWHSWILPTSGRVTPIMTTCSTGKSPHLTKDGEIQKVSEKKKAITLLRDPTSSLEVKHVGLCFGHTQSTSADEDFGALY